MLTYVVNEIAWPHMGYRGMLSQEHSMQLVQRQVATGSLEGILSRVEVGLHYTQETTSSILCFRRSLGEVLIVNLNGFV